MTCAAVGLLLRVSYELDRAQRQVARVRNGVNAATLEHAQDAPPEPATPEARRDALRRRIEPTLGRAA
jgi:cell division protein FtsW